MDVICSIGYMKLDDVPSNTLRENYSYHCKQSREIRRKALDQFTNLFDSRRSCFVSDYAQLLAQGDSKEIHGPGTVCASPAAAVRRVSIALQGPMSLLPSA